MLTIKVKRIEEQALLPQFAKEGDACADLRSLQSLVIEPYKFVTVRTGIAIELPPGWEAQIRPRSGLAAKHGIMVTNSPGTIDSGYRGEIAVLLLNFSLEPFTIKAGDRIAQKAIREAPKISFEDSTQSVQHFISNTHRGVSGLGSTGTS